MSRKRALDIEGRTLLIRLWKADTDIKDIASILNVSRGVIDRELQELRTSGLIDPDPRAAIKKKRLLGVRPTNDSTDPRHNRAMRMCLRCGTSFNSSHCGNRLCKGCINFASHGGGRALL